MHMQVGDVLVFGNLTFHRSLENTSEDIRWSVDLRYSPTGSPLEWLLEKWPGFIARSERQPEIGRILGNVGSEENTRLT